MNAWIDVEMLAFVKNITELTDVFALTGIQAEPAGKVKRATLLWNARTLIFRNLSGKIWRGRLTFFDFDANMATK